jgi:hypothetical protein
LPTGNSWFTKLPATNTCCFRFVEDVHSKALWARNSQWLLTFFEASVQTTIHPYVSEQLEFCKCSE